MYNIVKVSVKTSQKEENMKRCFYAFLYAVMTMGAGYALYLITLGLSLSVHEALMDWFPTVFKDYSPVLEAAEYESARNAVELTAVVAALFIAPIIVTRFDNGRDEYIISKTEGFYRIHELIPTYYKLYTLPDLISSLAVTATVSALIIPAYFYTPEKISRLSEFIMDFRNFYIGTLFDRWGYIIAPIAVFALTFIFKIISGIPAMKRWRAAWLTFN